MALTSKELSFLEDQLAFEQLMVKKYQAAENMATDESVRVKMRNAAERHQQHFAKLMSHLN